MTENQIILTDTECQLLHSMSQLTGKSERDLLQEALGLLKVQVDLEKRRALLQEARGMWRDRDDLPALSELRSEMNRS
jgi:flagellar biosynthesis/type III secretory pathway chaperone